MKTPPAGIGLRQALEASMLLSPDEQRGYVRGLARSLESVEELSRSELEQAVERTRSTWEKAADEEALRRIAADSRQLAAMPGRTLAEVASSLVQAAEARQARLTTMARLGVGGALAGFVAAMALPHPALQAAGLALGLASAATAGYAGVQKYRAPEMQTLLRLSGYGALAVETRRLAARQAAAEQEVRDLVDSLGRGGGPEVRVAPEGVQIGGVWLPRR